MREQHEHCLYRTLYEHYFYTLLRFETMDTIPAELSVENLSLRGA